MSATDQSVIFDHKLIIHKVRHSDPIVFHITKSTAQQLYDTMNTPFSRRALFHHEEGTAMLRFKEVAIIGIENNP